MGTSSHVSICHFLWGYDRIDKGLFQSYHVHILMDKSLQRSVSHLLDSYSTF